MSHMRDSPHLWDRALPARESKNGPTRFMPWVPQSQHQ